MAEREDQRGLEELVYLLLAEGQRQQRRADIHAVPLNARVVARRYLAAAIEAHGDEGEPEHAHQPGAAMPGEHRYHVAEEEEIGDDRVAEEQVEPAQIALPKSFRMNGTMLMAKQPLTRLKIASTTSYIFHCSLPLSNSRVCP